MRSWLKLMPWFVVVWFAQRHCERFRVNGVTCVQPFRNGPFILLPEPFMNNKETTA